MTDPYDPSGTKERELSFYPEHEKIRALNDDNLVISEFLDWLNDEKGWWVCETHYHDDTCHTSIEGERPTLMCGLIEGGYIPVRLTREKILAEYFDIDLDKFSREKDQMVKEMRDAQEAAGVDQR